MGIDASAVARVVGVETAYKNLRSGAVQLPQRIAVIGQADSSKGFPAPDPVTIKSAVEAGDLWGFGSPIHLAAKQLMPVGVQSVVPVKVYPLSGITTAGAQAVGDITPIPYVGDTQTVVVVCAGERSDPVTLTDGDTVAEIVTALEAAIIGNVAWPMTVTDSVTQLDMFAKWMGPSGNDLRFALEFSGAPPAWALTEPVGGLADPDVQTALDLITTVWETMLVNCAGPEDPVMDLFQTWGEGRWDSLVKKPAVVFSGTNASTLSGATGPAATRLDDRVNVLVWVRENTANEGASTTVHPLQIAAAACRESALQANSNPAKDYSLRPLSTHFSAKGFSSASFADRDAAVKAGVSTTEKQNGVIVMSDTVTMYRPQGEDPPAYRYVSDIVKLQNLTFNLDLEFTSLDWAGSPLIPDDQPTVNPLARKPKDAVAAVAGIIDSMGLDAILSDPETAKKTITAVINGANPRRLDVAFTIQVSGNAAIISVDQAFGFFFGSAPVV